jgi:hypothetical protein
VVPAAFARPPGPGEFDATRGLESRSEILPQVGGIGPPARGESFTAPIQVAQLPYEDTRSTCGFRHDVVPSCNPEGGAPDVVYAFRPQVPVCIDIDLCESGFDTALHVYDGGPESPLACVDDTPCGSGSRLEGLSVQPGRTYYVVVDGAEGACGDYVLRLAVCPPPCPVTVPAGALPEGEPPCTDGYYDSYNTGCNDVPYRFTPLPCDDDELVVRGSYGTWMYGREEFRDTDWYQIVVRRPAELEYRVVGGGPTQIAVLDGTPGCPEWGLVCDSILGAACDTLSCRANVGPGTYWLFVAPRYFTGVACGTEYALTLRGHACPSIGVDPAPWTWVKSRYR